MTERETDSERRTREQREAAERAGQGLLSWLNPFNWGFSSLLMLGLVGGAMYFFGATDRGRAMIGQFFEGLSPEWQQRLAGWGANLGLLPQGVSETISADPAAAGRAMAIAREHGVSITGGVDGYLQPDLMFALMTREPGFVLSLARNLPRTGEQSETTQRAMAAVRQIVNDPAKLTTLLSMQHKANTYALLEVLSPIPFAPGTLGRFIDTAGLRNGQPTAEFRQFLGAMLDENSSNRVGPMLTFLRGVNPAALRALLDPVNLESITDPRLREQVQGLKTLVANPTTMGVALDIDNSLRERGSSLDTILPQVSTVNGMVTFMLNPQNRDVIRPHRGRLGVMAEQMANSLENTPQNASQRMFLNFIGTRQRINGQPDQAVNVTALVNFFDRIGGNAHNQGANAERTRTVLAGMLGMMTGDNEAAAGLTPQNMAQFFANDGNAEAFRLLLSEMRETHLPDNLKNLVGGLREHWGTRQGGIVDVLDDSQNITYLLQQMRNPTPRGLVQRVVGDEGMAWLSSSLPTAATWVSDAPYDVAENADHLLALRNLLQAGGFTANGRNR